MQQTNVSTRNYSLDMLKFLLSFVIVIHHSPAPFQDFIQPLTTCAVPTFFMISGYLIFSREITTQRIMRNAKRILSIFGGAIILFFIWSWIRHSEPYIPTVKDILLFVFANNEPFSGHLWYLAAYAYALFLIAFLSSKGKLPWIKYIAIAGLVLYFAFDLWHIYKNIPKYLTLVYCFRNFFFTAIPMMYLGSIINKKPTQQNRSLLLLMTLLFSTCALLEINWLSLNHIADVFFLTIPISATIFLLFAVTPVYKSNVFAVCGEKYSLYIYILHPIVINTLVSYFGKETYYLGVLSFFITLCLSFIYVWCKARVLNKINNR